MTGSATGQVYVLQRLRAEPGHVLHENLLFAAILNLLGCLDIATRLQSDLVAEDLKIRRRVARGVIVSGHSEQAPGPGRVGKATSEGGLPEAGDTGYVTIPLGVVRCGGERDVRWARCLLGLGTTREAGAHSELTAAHQGEVVVDRGLGGARPTKAGVAAATMDGCWH